MNETKRQALQIMKKRNELNKLPGKMSKFSDEQIFFLSYANVSIDLLMTIDYCIYNLNVSIFWETKILLFLKIWCSNPKPEAIENQVATDEHSPEKFRVLGTLSNFDEFSKAFDCKIGSNMNKNSSKCQLW
jgi:hypothetical protein